jgi:hypothetical protein
MDSHLPRWLRIALLPAVAAGGLAAAMLARDEPIADDGLLFAMMRVTAFVAVAVASALLTLVLATLVALALGWRPRGPGDSGGGGGGGPNLPITPPRGFDWDDFDRLRAEWESAAEARRPCAGARG